MYCILCQEEHVTAAKCFVNVKCKSCGLRGHLRKDCPRNEQSKRKSHRSRFNQERKAVKNHNDNFDTPFVTDLSCCSVVNICKDKDTIDTELKQNGKAKEKLVKITDNIGIKRDDSYSYDESLAATEYYEEFAAEGDILNDAGMSLSLKEEVGIIHISDDDHEDNHGSNNNVCTIDLDNTSGESGIKEKNKNTDKRSKIGLKKYDQDLDPGKYNIVSVHVELLRSSKHLSTSLTQVGCVAFGSDDSFFRSIKPSCLEEYLDCYKLGGDLLQALHMTREDDGSFLFRKRFEDVDNSSKIVCVEESEALWGLRRYLRKYSNCVILGVDQETLAILADKIGFNYIKFNTVGFTYWKRVLKYLDVEDYDKVELEDYCGEGLASFNSALDIAKLLMKSVDDISSQKKSGRKSMKCKFYKLCKNIDFLSKPKQKVYENGDGDHIEVFSSFRPTMVATMSAEKLEQVVISSESDAEPEETGSMDRQLGQASTTILDKNTSPSYWKIGKFREGEFGKQGEPESCVFCPRCTIRIKFKNIRAHINRNHAQFLLNRSLLCAVCDKAVLPSEVRVHMPSCIATGLSSKKPASSTQASKIPSSSKSKSIPSQKLRRSAKAKLTLKPSQAASSTREMSDQLKSTPEPQQLRRSLRLQRKSQLLTVLRQQRKARIQTSRPLSPADTPCAPAASGPQSTPLTASASPPCARPTSPAGPPCAPAVAVPQSTPLTASASPSGARPTASTGQQCAPAVAVAQSTPLTASASPSGARPTAPTGQPCAPPPASDGPPSTASIGPPLFFKIGPGLIHPHLNVFEGVPDFSNMLRRELGRYVTTNFCPVGLGGWGYVHCLWMYEDYQNAMVFQGKTVVVSPSVFSVLVPEMCERHWGIVLDKSNSRYGPLGHSQFQFCFVGIMPRHKK